MAMKLAFFILLTISTSAFFSSALPNDINWWCDKTPNPEPCKHFMSGKQQKYGLIMGKSGFRKAAVELAMERALTAESHTKWLGQKCRNEKEKAAWADCLTLYEDTISQLNQTLDPTTKCTDFDAQTWLSAALTNLETCHAGFMELNASDYMLPLMSNNVTKLISNTLAINNGSSSPVESYKHGFPKWVRPGDRKLLQTAAPRPNIVVAKDGSGNYRTIKAAIDVAAKRSGSGRFVIRIKRGVYFENIEIDKKMKNIMLVGDGVKYTIISGSRSVGGGSTTFKSGTVSTLNLSADTSFNPKKEGLIVCLELGIHDHNNEQSSLKLVPKVVPSVDKTATSRQELELLFHYHITMLRLQLGPERQRRLYVTVRLSLALEEKSSNMIDNLTQDVLIGPTYDLMQGTCKSVVELEYHLEEVFKATNDQLDWHNPKGRSYPHDLSKPLPLISNARGRQVIPFDHFINNNLEYLKGGSLSQRYTTSITKTKAIDYGHVKWIEDKVPSRI
ncbi:pectinesterase 2 [Tanacetum coccineum]